MYSAVKVNANGKPAKSKPADWIDSQLPLKKRQRDSILTVSIEEWTNKF
jgi:hypothetical protein